LPTSLNTNISNLGADSQRPLIVGATGGTASGKTSMCLRIRERLGEKVTIISLDSFYKGLSEEDHANAANYDFDHPRALDFDLAFEVLTDLMQGRDT